MKKEKRVSFEKKKKKILEAQSKKQRLTREPHAERPTKTAAQLSIEHGGISGKTSIPLVKADKIGVSRAE